MWKRKDLVEFGQGMVVGMVFSVIVLLALG